MDNFLVCAFIEIIFGSFELKL